MIVSVLPQAEKGLKKISKINQFAIAQKLRSFVVLQNIPGEEKLTGYKNLFRVQVGVYRIVYTKKEKLLRVVLIGHRKEVYDLLTRLVK